MHCILPVQELKQSNKVYYKEKRDETILKSGIHNPADSLELHLFMDLVYWEIMAVYLTCWCLDEIVSQPLSKYWQQMIMVMTGSGMINSIPSR